MYIQHQNAKFNEEELKTELHDPIPPPFLILLDHQRENTLEQ